MIKETYILEVNNFGELKQNCWSGAIQTLEAIEEKGLESEFIELLNDMIQNCFDGRIEETKLNDFIWFDTDYIEEYLNVTLWED